MRILGVSSRIEAARLLQSAEISAGEPAGASIAKPADPLPGSELPRRLPLPFPTAERPQNNLSLLQRAGWMVGLIIGLALATGILLSGLTAISTLLIAMSK